jgi:hypothetical protein
LASWQVAARLELASMGKLPKAPSEERVSQDLSGATPRGTSWANQKLVKFYRRNLSAGICGILFSCGSELLLLCSVGLFEEK